MSVAFARAAKSDKRCEVNNCRSGKRTKPQLCLSLCNVSMVNQLGDRLYMTIYHLLYLNLRPAVDA
jgi:hypothetical protein